jgi:hypothetical protein
VTPRDRWVTLSDRWVTLSDRWVTLAQRTAWQYRQSCAERRRTHDANAVAVEEAVAMECAAPSGGVVPGCDTVTTRLCCRLSCSQKPTLECHK